MNQNYTYDVSYIGALQRAIRQYATFSGRASRSEYWRYTVAQQLIITLLTLLHVVALTIYDAESMAVYIFYGILMVVTVFFMLPSIAITCRRLHDVGKSGWNILLGLIPVVGYFIILYYLILPRQAMGDVYGPATAYVPVNQDTPGGREPTPSTREDWCMGIGTGLLYIFVIALSLYIDFPVMFSSFCESMIFG